jgi:7-cyano-7-deazaguanine synthase
LKSVVLLSGGLDSTVSLHQAMEKAEIVLCLHFNYGQKAALQEIASAKKITEHYKVPLKIIDLPWLAEITRTSLVNKELKVPTPSTEQLDGEAARQTAMDVWVPNRNGLFINIAAAFAESMGADAVVTGFNAEEAITFPDNSLPFIESIKKSLSYSTLNKVKVISYTQPMNKIDIVKLARQKNIPIELCWSCYLGGEKPCGKCESCLRLQRAL